MLASHLNVDKNLSGDKALRFLLSTARLGAAPFQNNLSDGSNELGTDS
jgi:hypothetical protein